jgi:two-component sensor histidine kinase
MSTEFLFQPFIWRNFDLEGIFVGWIGIARDRLVAAWAIALCLVVLGRPKGERTTQIVAYVVAVVAGASAGEALLMGMTAAEERETLAALSQRIVRWCLVGGAIAVIVQFWRSGGELARAAEESRLRAVSARRLAASTQLEMLRRQIEPHFLFNTLATIRRLQETDPQQSRFLLDRLFQYMSATLNDSSARASKLGDEIALVSAYLDVCASRMGGRLTVAVDIEPGLEAVEFPPLVLATLAENAVKHGVFPQNGGQILIKAVRRGDRAEVALIDDGVGLSGEGGGGLGLANITERLRLLYGPKGEVSLRANHPKGVCAVVRIPLGLP